MSKFHRAWRTKRRANRREVVASDLKVGNKIVVNDFRYPTEITNIETDSIKITAWTLMGKATFHATETVVIY